MPNTTPLFNGSPNTGTVHRTNRTISVLSNPTSFDTLPSPTASAFADMLLDLAAAVEAQEAAIKVVLLEAADAGNLELIKKIVGLWANGPVSEVVAQLHRESCVDSNDASVA